MNWGIGQPFNNHNVLIFQFLSVSFIEVFIVIELNHGYIE